MADPQFKKEDVWAVARAIGDGLWVDESGRNAHLYCQQCNASRIYIHREEYGPQAAKFVHEKNCPVLIAHDLLVGAATDDSDVVQRK